MLVLVLSYVGAGALGLILGFLLGVLTHHHHTHGGHPA